MMNPAKHESITIALSENQKRYIENTCQFIENETGCKVTPASIILRMMDIGLPQFEKEMQRLRQSRNADQKRFPKLHLAYSSIELSK